MWKRSIILCIVGIVSVASRGFAPQSAINSYEAKHNVAKGNSINYQCRHEIEKVCGAQPAVHQAIQDQVIIDKSIIFQGEGNEKADVINAMKSAIHQLYTPLPGNFNQYVINVVPSVSQDIQITNMDGVDAVLASWNLPAQVSNFLSNIKFSEEVIYQTYKFAIQNGNSELQEFIASGRNSGEKIVLGYMKVSVQGTPIQQYIVTKNCQKSWFSETCTMNAYPRGFTTDEIIIIQNGFLNVGYQNLMYQMNQLSPYVEALPHIQAKAISKIHVHQTDGDKMNWLEKAIVESYMQMKEQFDVETHSEAVQKISNLGFNSFVEDAEIKFIKNMDAKYYDAFAANLVSGLDVKDDETSFKIHEYMEMVPFTEIGQWNMMRTIYNVNQKSDANYICIMTFRDENEKYSIYTVQMKNSFEIAPDILIMRDSKSTLGGLFKVSSERVERVPHSMTPVDLQQMLDYFDLVAFDRFIKIFNRKAVEIV